MKRKFYIIRMDDGPDGSRLHRWNRGFSPIELLGLLEKTQLDILAQMAWLVKVDEIKRTVIEGPGEGE